MPVLKFMRTDKTGFWSVWDSEAASLGKNPKYLQQLPVGSDLRSVEVREVLTNPRPGHIWV